jgi:hypothetical protein
MHRPRVGRLRSFAGGIDEIEAAPQDLRWQLHLGRLHPAHISRVMPLRDVFGQCLQRHVAGKPALLVVDDDLLAAAIANRGDDRRQGHDPNRETVRAENGVHQRSLASAEASDEDQVESVFREPGKELLKPLLAVASLVFCQQRKRAEEFRQLELRPFVFP